MKRDIHHSRRGKGVLKSGDLPGERQTKKKKNTYLVISIVELVVALGKEEARRC